MWQDIIKYLVSRGLSQRDIAKQVGVSQAHICDLANGKRGKRIGYELGQKLNDLHARELRRQKRVSA